jgi:hypothetical protein
MIRLTVRDVNTIMYPGSPDKFLLVIVTVLMVFMIVPSCDTGKEDPLYVGSWQFTERIVTNELTYNTTRTLILTRDTWEEVYMIQREGSGLISGIFGTKGKLAFSRLYMTFRLEGLGTCVRDASDACTEEIEWFGNGTQYWNDNLPYFQLLVKGDFETDELLLKLKRDLNNDKDTDDIGEDIVFTRI